MPSAAVSLSPVPSLVPLHEMAWGAPCIMRPGSVALATPSRRSRDVASVEQAALRRASLALTCDPLAPKRLHACNRGRMQRRVLSLACSTCCLIAHCVVAACARRPTPPPATSSGPTTTAPRKPHLCLQRPLCPLPPWWCPSPPWSSTPGRPRSRRHRRPMWGRARCAAGRASSTMTMTTTPRWTTSPRTSPSTQSSPRPPSRWVQRWASCRCACGGASPRGCWARGGWGRVRPCARRSPTAATPLPRAPRAQAYSPPPTRTHMARSPPLPRPLPFLAAPQIFLRPRMLIHRPGACACAARDDHRRRSPPKTTWTSA
jgi:hypothetical protein